MLEHLRDLLNHMAWADAQFFHSWSKGPVQDEELRERWAHILKDKGGKNSNVDYIIWVWKGRPAARWT